MTIAEHKTRLRAQLSDARERKAQLSDALKQTEQGEQQLIGALAILEQLEQEAKVPASQPSPLPDDGVKKNDGGESVDADR